MRYKAKWGPTDGPTVVYDFLGHVQTIYDYDFELTQITTAPDQTDLSQYSVIWISSLTDFLTTAEKTALKNWVEGSFNRRLVILGECYMSTDYNARTNDLLHFLGMKSRIVTARLDLYASKVAPPYIPNYLTEGVDELLYVNISYIEFTPDLAGDGTIMFRTAADTADPPQRFWAVEEDIRDTSKGSRVLITDQVDCFYWPNVSARYGDAKVNNVAFAHNLCTAWNANPPY
jgi:hypothetical protein